MDDTVDFGGNWMPLGHAYLSHDELNARGTGVCDAKVTLESPRKAMPPGEGALLFNARTPRREEIRGSILVCDPGVLAVQCL